jgi:nitrite reductase/ring-hydroxylating ferredoxin subunit
MSWVGLGEAGGRRSWTVQHGGRDFAVFLVGERCYVTDARCPHNGGPLAQGWIRGGRELVCPWHWYAYDLETGQCRTAAGYRLDCYPVTERDGEFYADLPEPPPRRSWAERLRAHARGEHPPSQASQPHPPH